MHFPGWKTYVFVVERIHFQKSDIFAMSKREVLRVSLSSAQSYSERAQSYSENLSNSLEIHAFSENVRGAADISTFRSPHIGNSCSFELVDLEFDQYFP